jgi:tetratricopeptide (TPR) repeat protein
MKAALSIAVLALALAACGGKSAADYANDARAALDAGDTAKAIAVVDEALAKDAVRQDAAGAWRLEQVRLDALAKAGKGADLLTHLERVAGTHPQQVNASFYRSLADRVKAAGDTSGAIDVLAAGDKRFPAEHESFVTAIDALKSSGGLDPEKIKQLKQLGYL